jgi:signal transduction histidine kinase
LELRFRRSDKKLDRIYSYGGTTVRNTAGQLQFVLLTITDITAHAQAQISLRQAKEHAESTDRAKDHFLAVVSHELRTPLTPVLAATTGLQARTDLPADVGDELQMIRRNVELEARLVDDLLTLTRLHRGKIFLHQETVDVSAIIRTAIDQSQDEIETKRLELKVDADGGESVIWADPTRFQQSVSNLLSNAVKFTPDKGTISIHTTSAGGKFRLEVSDTGVGIEPDVLARLFNPFEQGEQTVTRKFGGLGLGLSIAKQFIELHGGTLTAASDGPGRGARFTIELDAVAIGPIDLKAPAPPASISARPVKASSKKQSVLLVEDHPDTARILARLLKSIGYSVTTAGTVAEALALADGHRFDFLLSDIGLPDGSGCEIARELCSRKLVARALALSGFGQPEDIARSLEAGFADHLIKPINFEKLRDVLASLATPSK